MKFKTGDKVVLVEQPGCRLRDDLGSIGIIVKVHEDQRLDVQFPQQKGLQIYSRRVIHEEIYNTSLYKALREED